MQTSSPVHRHQARFCHKRLRTTLVENVCEVCELSHLAVDDHHVQRVIVQPVLHGLTDGADLIQRRSVQVRPARV